MANNKKGNIKKKNNNIKAKVNNNTKKNKVNSKTNSKSKINNTNSKNKNLKKSNYSKIQDKVLENKKNEKVKDNRKKQVKQKKQVVRKEKKVEKAKERTLKRKIILLLLSIVIKIKYLFVKIFNGLKNGLLFIIKYIKKFGLFLKNSFLNLINKIKNVKNKNKVEKVKKENKPKKQKVKKEKNKDLLAEEKKGKVLKSNGKNKLLRSLTGRIFPTSFLKGDKKRRRTIYLKEALIIAIFITILDFIGFYNSNYFDMLHIFDNSLFNLIATVTLTLLITFIGAYIIDLMVTEIFLKIRKKKGRGSK